MEVPERGEAKLAGITTRIKIGKTINCCLWKTSLNCLIPTDCHPLATRSLPLKRLEIPRRPQALDTMSVLLELDAQIDQFVSALLSLLKAVKVFQWCRLTALCHCPSSCCCHSTTLDRPCLRLLRALPSLAPDHNSPTIFCHGCLLCSLSSRLLLFMLCHPCVQLPLQLCIPRSLGLVRVHPCAQARGLVAAAARGSLILVFLQLLNLHNLTMACCLQGCCHRSLIHKRNHTRFLVAMQDCLQCFPEA
mmetsp:Transcript_14506/g.38510  ORF Transcript_14506/g.38510 Transcript_14506/m.38510 type:complete len:248 (-) Transcript_14506:343-1086(-)